MNRADVGMVQPTGCPRFSEEPSTGVRVYGVRPHALDRDPALQPFILRKEHLAHAAGAEPGQNGVVRNAIDGHRASILLRGRRETSHPKAEAPRPDYFPTSLLPYFSGSSP